MDWLAAGNLVGGLASTIGSVADPYFYTNQEQAKDKLTADQIAAQQAAIAAQAQANHEREMTNQKAISFGVAAVLGVGGLYLASRLIK